MPAAPFAGARPGGCLAGGYQQNGTTPVLLTVMYGGGSESGLGVRWRTRAAESLQPRRSYRYASHRTHHKPGGGD